MVSLFLGVQHKGLAGESICSVDATFDCDRVNTSVYAELFDVPIAFLISFQNFRALSEPSEASRARCPSPF